MTTIAWDGKTLAADRQATRGDRRMLCPKLAVVRSRHRGGLWALATTGGRDAGRLLVQWWQAGARVDKWPASQATEDWCTLVVAGPGGCWVYDKLCIAEPAQAADSWGSGAPYALGAMAAGATAEQAVLIAQKYDVYSGFGCDHATPDPYHRG